MGYYINQSHTEFFMEAEAKPYAAKAIKSLIGNETCGDHFSWVNDFEHMNTLEEILTEWRWDTKIDEYGNITNLYFSGEKLGDDELLFQTIGPFVKEDSFIEMHGEEGAIWRWVFENGNCIEKSPTITW